MLNKKILLVGVLVSLSGCSIIGKLASAAGDASDEALASAEFTICNAATVGSILRRYDTLEEARVWQSLCLPNVKDVLTPRLENPD